MTDMITLAARAIRDSDAIWAARHYPELPPEKIAEYVATAAKEMGYEEMARAAIEAIREPHIRMLIAGVRAMRTDDLDVTEAELKLGWQAAIDAALASPPTPEDAGESA